MLKSWPSRCHDCWQQLSPGVYLGKTLKKSSHFENWPWGHLQQKHLESFPGDFLASFIRISAGLGQGQTKNGARGGGQLVGVISSLHVFDVCPYTSREFGSILWWRWTHKLCRIKGTGFFHFVQLSLCTRPSHLGIIWGLVRNAVSHTLPLTYWVRFSVLFSIINRSRGNLQAYSSLSSIFLW